MVGNHTTSSFSERRIAARNGLAAHLRLPILLFALISVMVLLTVAFFSRSAVVAVDDAPHLDVEHLYTLAQNGEGQQVILEVAAVAQARGAWSAAPGDELVFDPYMPRRFRGAVIDFDEAPPACFDPRGAFDTQRCVDEFRAKETQVRFGLSLFSTPTDKGVVIRTPDDVLATFIEETGHSWQEYAFETNGQMIGQRVRQTSLVEAQHWARGREYQVKMYLLSLDGEYLALSDNQRRMLLEQICKHDGYANPLGQAVPAYGSPHHWPHPEGWPVAAPTLDSHMAFCTSQLG